MQTSENKKFQLRLYLQSEKSNIPQLFHYIKKSCETNIIETIILVFKIRDCRYGKGQRKIGRFLFIWLMLNYPEHFIKVCNLIPIFGRWDDLFYLISLNTDDINFLNNNYISNIKNIKLIEEIKNKLLYLTIENLENDLYNMNCNKNISYCAKWFPSEKSSAEKKFKIFKKVCNILNISPKTLRKKYITPLRAYLEIVENKMCKNDWDYINFKNVTSVSLVKYKKAFENNCKVEFDNFNKSKLCLKKMYPYEIINKIIQKKSTNVVLETIWKQFFKNITHMSKTIFCIDNSPSMKSFNYYLTISFALSVSENYKGIFKNKLLNFSNNPEFYNIIDNNLYHKYNQIKNIDWSGTIDFNKIYDLILNKCLENKISSLEVPENLFIITDISYDVCNTIKTDFKYIDKKYNTYNYKKPKIIFWNVVMDEQSNFPYNRINNDIILINGNSKILINHFYNNSFNPDDIISEINNIETYKNISINLK